jgi:hypothetical protein
MYTPSKEWLNNVHTRGVYCREYSMYVVYFQTTATVDTINELYNGMLSVQCPDVSNDEKVILYYIAGALLHSMLKRVEHCPNCYSILVETVLIELFYITKKF